MYNFGIQHQKSNSENQKFSCVAKYQFQSEKYFLKMLKSYSIVRKIVNVSSTSIKRSQSLKSGQQMRSFAAQKQPELQQAVREHIPLKPSSADQFAANAGLLFFSFFVFLFCCFS